MASFLSMTTVSFLFALSMATATTATTTAAAFAASLFAALATFVTTFTTADARAVAFVGRASFQFFFVDDDEGFFVFDSGFFHFHGR